MVLALAAKNETKTRDCLQYHVPTVFVNSPVDESIFVKKASGREETDKNGGHQVMRLRKSLYGISQAPANWRGTIDGFVTTIGFKPLTSEPCIYINIPKTKKGPAFVGWSRTRPSSPSTSMIYWCGSWRRNWCGVSTSSIWGMS